MKSSVSPFRKKVQKVPETGDGFVGSFQTDILDRDKWYNVMEKRVLVSEVDTN